MSRQSTLKSIFWLTFSEILFNISGYIIHMVAGRTLGPADYGRYSLVITLTTVLVVLIGNGIPTAMAKYLSEAFEHTPSLVPAIRKQGIKLQSILIGIVTILFFVSAPLIAHLLNDPTLTPLFQLSALIIPAFAAASFYFSYFTGLHLFNHQSILKSFRSVARVAIIVGLVLTYGLKGAIIGYIIAPLLTFFVGVYLDAKLFKKNYAHINIDQAFPYQKLLQYAWPITLFMLFYEIFVSIDIYLIKAIVQDDVATGIYNAALTIGRIPYYLFYALAIFLLPSLAKIKSENDPQRLRATMTQSLRYAGIILLPIVLCIIAYALPIVHLFFGNHYDAAAPVLQILVIGLSFLTVFYLLCSALNGVGAARLSMWLSLIGTLFSITLNSILIHRMGIMGAAYATTISGCITTGIAFIFFQQHIPISINWYALSKTSIIGMFIFSLSLLLPATSLLFILYSALLCAVYFGLLFATRVLSVSDVQFFYLKKKTDPAQ